MLCYDICPMESDLQLRKQAREEKYAPFRELLDEVEGRILNQPAENWWFLTLLFLLRKTKAVAQNPTDFPTEMKTFFTQYGPLFLQLIRSEAAHPSVTPASQASPTQEQEANATAAVRVMHALSEILMADEEIAYEEHTITHLTFEELCQLSPRFRYETKIENGVSRDYFCVYSVAKDNWYCYPLPRTEQVLHKGGLGRTILKILTGVSSELIEAELPPNDFDYVAVKNEEGIRDVHELHADPDGVEWIHELDLQELMNNRDLDINNAFIGKNGIYFAESALESAKKGKIAIVATKRGIYGSEIFFYQGVRLLKNRGIMRLMKTIAEGKAESFDFLPINEHIQLGIYWLVLAKRFSQRKNFAVVLDRLFELGKRIGQVPVEATTVFEVLDAVHEKYPFFDFEDAPLDEEGVARWLGRKFINQIDKKYRDIFEIPSLLMIPRAEGDTEAYEAHLRDYRPDPDRLEHIRQEWPNFIRRARRRTVASREVYENELEDAEN
jgi:hypothetical protein